MSLTEEGRKQFDYLRKHLPKSGDVLTSLDGTPVTVLSSERDGKRTKFVNACIDQSITGWYLVNSEKGLKCLISPKDHDSMGPTVTRLKVLRQSDNGKYLVCTVLE